MNLPNLIWSKLLSFLKGFSSKQTLAVDLENSQIKILSFGQKSIFCQSLCIATHQYLDQVLAFGDKADQLYGKTSSKLKICYPFFSNKLVDQDMFARFIDQVSQILNLKNFQYKVVLAKPWGISKVHQEILLDILKKRWGNVELLDRSFATYFYLAGRRKIGSESCIIQAEDSLLEISVFSQGKMISSSGLEWGKDSYLDLIETIIKEKYQLQISKNTAKKSLIEVGKINIGESNKVFKTTIRGKNLITNLPEAIQISSADFSKQFLINSKVLIDQISEFFGQLDPDMLNLVLDQGLVLTGSCQKIIGLKELLEQEFKCKVFLPENTEDIVVKGLYLYGQEKLQPKKN